MQARPERLFSTRLVQRVLIDGRPFLVAMLKGEAFPLYTEVEAIFTALWNRADLRSDAARIAETTTTPDAQYREFLVEKMYGVGLLVDARTDEAAAWIARQEQGLAPMPQVDQIELTNACPFGCPFCPRGAQKKMNRPIGHLDLGLLAELLAQVKHLPQRKPLGLHHFGDPLLHPHAADAVRLVREAGLQPEISVNPILLTEKKAKGLLDAGIGVLIISMDGLDTKTLQAMRGAPAGEFEEAARNVERLIELATAMAHPPDVMVSMVATKLNRHHWGELFRRYQRAGLDWLKPVVRVLDDFGDPAMAPLAVERLRMPCAMPYQTVSVMWDGTVVPCCHDFNGVITYGNLREQSLEQIWKGEKLQRFRERWKRLEFTADEPCARCRWRIDHYLGEPTVANTDAWTSQLWPEEPFPRQIPPSTK